ncbi:hypothetical protein BT67DRAFT_265632 [Trichocladium antarcticum]|uniref:Uncharacterized protein n=1 Tax=Trichocladium antarcticum TaxID=1450529 RepID=A0AAN6ZEB1_9PEZI|nr:hypothetical protein BT67DRAFT_265632 [Trichocladium antarcticum]
MFRIFRPFHRLIPHRRLLARAPLGQVIQIERVKVTKRRHPTRFFGAMIGGAVLIQLVLSTPTSIITDKRNSNSGGGSDSQDEEEGGWFIPFPLTTNMVPGESYSGHGPEWQQFVKIANSPKMQEHIRHLAVQLVYQAASKSAGLVSKVGNVTGIAAFYLDLDYPYHAPPEYERSGILVTDDEVAWATMTFDTATAKKLHQVLWPRPLALGFWALGWEVVKQTTADCARYFGLAAEGAAGAGTGPNVAPTVRSLESQLADVQKAVERIRQQATRRPDEVKDPRSMSSSGAGAAPAAPAAPDKALRVPANPAERGHQDAPDGKGISSFPGPVQKAIRTYTRARRQGRPDPPRGCVHVSGLVKLETSDGWLTVMMVAWFNPKTGKYHAPSAALGLQKWELKSRHPRLR